MTNNPYSPPTAPVADVGHGGLVDQSNPYFAVGLVKLAVMNMVTFGIYQVYWFYRQWNFVRVRDRSDIWPVPRAIFAIIFVYPLFQRIRSDAAQHQVPGGLAAGPLATVFILCNFIWRAPDPWWLAGFLTTVVVVVAQKVVNEINVAASPDHDRNERFGGWNWFGIVVGGVFWALVMIGLLFGVEE
ncbi:MAG: hypothetical protein WDO72_17960 [Pseudomonadota bacterium]